MQVGDVLQQRRKALLADLVRPLFLEFGDDFARGAHLGSSAVCGADERGSPIAWIWGAMDVSEALKIVDERGHRLWRHAGRSGELREPYPVLVEMLEDLGVGGSEVVEALLRQALEQCGVEGVIGQAKRDRGVASSEADGQIA